MAGLGNLGWELQHLFSSLIMYTLVLLQNLSLQNLYACWVEQRQLLSISLVCSLISNVTPVRRDDKNNGSHKGDDHWPTTPLPLATLFTFHAGLSFSQHPFTFSDSKFLPDPSPWLLVTLAHGFTRVRHSIQLIPSIFAGLPPSSLGPPPPGPSIHPLSVAGTWPRNIKLSYSRR